MSVDIGVYLVWREPVDNGEQRNLHGVYATLEAAKRAAEVEALSWTEPPQFHIEEWTLEGT